MRTKFVLMAALLTFFLGACENPAGEENKPTVETPTASPAAGAVPSDTAVTLSTATEGAVIYYTTGGTTPTEDSTRYTGPIALSSLTLPVTIKAVAVKEGWNNSGVLEAAYSAASTEPEKAAAPTASPAAGAVSSDATVTLSTATEGAAIYYTTGGTAPTADSILYTGPIALSSLTFPVTIKAVAVKEGWLDSEVLEVSYEQARSGTPAAGISAVGKKTAAQNAVIFSLTSQNNGTWRVYGTAEGGTVLTAETVSYDGDAKALTLNSAASSGLGAGVYYVSVEENGKTESGRLALTVKEPLIFELSFGAGTSVAETGAVTAYGSLLSMTYEDGKKGKAGIFPGGADNYLSITGTGGGNLFGGLGEFTVSFWVKTSSANSWWLYAAPDTRTQTYQSEYYVGILANQNGARLECERFLNGRTNGTLLSGDNSITMGTWTHVVLVHRKDAAEIYLNGVSKAALADARFIPDILGAAPICFIGRANWESGEGTTGSIDEYKIHSYALDSTEASALYTADGGEAAP